jgi:hypothetical protein
MTDRHRSLAWRLYGFAALMVVVAIGTLIASGCSTADVPRITRRGPSSRW